MAEAKAQVADNEAEILSLNKQLKELSKAIEKEKEDSQLKD